MEQDVYAVLLTNAPPCKCCGRPFDEPIPHLDAAVIPTKLVIKFEDGDVVISLADEIKWENVPNGVVGWGILDPEGNLLRWDETPSYGKAEEMLVVYQ